MPKYTIYALIIQHGRRRKHKVRNNAVYPFEETPLDWSDLKSVLLIAARTIYYDHNQQLTSDVTLEKHLGGKYIMKKTSYRQSRMHYKRDPQFAARISYNHYQGTIKFEGTPKFISPEFYQFKFDYESEKRKKFEMPSLVTAGFEAGLLNDDLLWVDNLTLKTPTYLQDPKDLYATQQAQRHSSGMYAGRNIGMYAAKNYQTLEVDKQDKQNQV